VDPLALIGRLVFDFNSDSKLVWVFPHRASIITKGVLLLRLSACPA